jgi:hypothetical protein
MAGSWSKPKPIPELRCRECGAENYAGAHECWLCGRQDWRGAPGVKPKPLPPAPPRPPPSEMGVGVPLIASGIVAAGVFLAAPTLILFLVVLGLPPYLFIRAFTNLRRKPDRPASVVGEIASIVALSLMILIMIVWPLFIAIFLMCGVRN